MRRRGSKRRGIRYSRALPGSQPAVSRAVIAACSPARAGQSSPLMIVSYSADFTVGHPIGESGWRNTGVGMPDCNTTSRGPAIWTNPPPGDSQRP